MNNAIVIYNNLIIDDPEYQQRVIDITEFYTYPPKGFDVFRTNNLNKTVNDLADRKYQWVIINIMGHCVDFPDVYLKAIKQCEQNNYPLMAHIVHMPNSYPTIDTQFIILNLQVWADVGSPEFALSNQRYSFNSVSVERSVENFHDDYTPHWIKPGKELIQHTGHVHGFGVNLVKAILEAGYTISNFDQDLRNMKWNLYANFNHEQLSPFFKDGTVTYDPGRVPMIIDRILNERASLNDTVYVLNSEDIYLHAPITKPITHYVGVAAGFKGILLLNNFGFTENTIVTYIDISHAGLDYQQYLIENWDGDISDYKNITNSYQLANPKTRIAWRSWNDWNNEINQFLTQSKLTADGFKILWQRYRLLKINYIQIDLLEDCSKLYSHLQNQQGNSYIWVSNSFDMQWTRFMLGKAYTQKKFDQFLVGLCATKLTGVVEASGRFYCLG